LHIPITDSLREFVETQASTKGFSCVEDYVQALIQKTQREWQNEHLVSELQVGIDELARGEGRPMTQANWDLLHARIGEQPDGGKSDTADHS
jgi:hypothetical protein